MPKRTNQLLNSSPVGIKEIAKRANVSIATVDRVLHNRGGVAKATKIKIQEILDEIDYHPNILASRLKSNKKYILGILIPEVSSDTTFWEAPYNGIIQALREIDNYGINGKPYLFNLSDKSSFVKRSQELLADNVDAVLMAPSFVPEASRFAMELEDRQIPYLLIDSILPKREYISYIGPNLRGSGAVAAQLTHLLLKKAKDQVLVINISSLKKPNVNLKEIEAGFHEYFESNYPNVHVHSLSLKDGNLKTLNQKLQNYLAENPAIRSIFVTNSRVHYVARLLEEQGKKHLSLIGFDYLEENLQYLKGGAIDFLICHKPEQQGYMGIMSLHQHLVLSQEVPNVQFMPIDIVTKENCDFYPN
ncbi:MAG: substrate-binding domain-containing protein [Saprospiraceae bacterium]|nr:substrate-binding domain-containing protein [Saprospiraceae bacterium]